MIRGLSQLALATVVRFGTGVFTFVFAAKHWMPDEFGQFMYCFSLATLLVLCADFGFAQQILNDVGANPRRLSVKMNRFFAAKSWLTVLVLIISIAYSFIARSAGSDQSTLVLVILLVGAGCAGSFTDLLFQALRAVGRYRDETRISLWTSAAALAVFTAVLSFDGQPLALAITFLIVRVAQFGLVAGGCKLSWFRWPRFLVSAKPRVVFNTIRHGQAFAYEVVVLAALSNVDTILVARMTGYAQAGIYQAAARLSQGVAIAFSVVAGYFLPKLAISQRSGHGLAGTTARMFFVAALVSALLVIGFIVVSVYYAHQPIGSVLEQAAPVLYGFAALVTIRVFSGSLAVLLTVQGRQGVRSVLYLAALVCFVVAAILLIPVMGIWGAIAAYLISYCLLALGFATLSTALFRSKIFTFTAALAICSLAAFWLIYSRQGQ